MYKKFWSNNIAPTEHAEGGVDDWDPLRTNAATFNVPVTVALPCTLNVLLSVAAPETDSVLDSVVAPATVNAPSPRTLNLSEELAIAYYQ